MDDDQWQGVDDDDLDNDSDYPTREFGSGRDGLIFLIDCAEDMMVKMEQSKDESSAFALAVKCAITVMKSKIISSERDLLGIVLYGVNKETDPDFKHVYAFQEMRQPGADNILALEELLKESRESFANNLGHSDDFSLSDAFWLCTSLFAKCSVKLSSRRILLFTNEENPHANNVQLQRQAIQKARDLQENNIELELLHINKNASRRFDVDLFYKNLLLLKNEDEESRLEDPSEKFNELLTRVRTKDHKQRTMGRIPFNLPGGVAFSVAIYNLVLPLKKTYPVKVAKDTNEVLQTITKTYLQDTGEILLPEDVLYYQDYSGKRTYFEKEEIAQIKQLMEPGFNLLCFESLDLVQPKHHKKHSSFLYPDDSLIRGSSKLFTALLKRCIDRKVMPVGWLTARKSSTPDLVALLPQEEELDSCKVQITPPGFNIIFIPFSEDIRDLVLENPPVKASVELIDKAKQIIKKLQFQFNSADFENPVLQTHWRNIEALALDLDQPEELCDSTLPKEEIMEERAGHLISEFQDEIGISDLTPSAKTKRKISPADKTPNKIIKIDLSAVKDEIDGGKLDKMTVPELKDLITRNQLDIKTSGKKKAELKEEIRTYLNY